MSTLELKSSFHQLIDKVDESILQDMYDTFKMYLITDSNATMYDDNSPAKLSRLRKALESAEKGNGITTEELKLKFKEWNTK
ncbi:MAG: hypothetical protein U5N85_06140 [Arcicella sp.]|nr:hypothetical protein [Arcicella sp.]